MKIGAELVDAIQPMAGLLSQSLNQDSQFYQFLESNPQHKAFLKQLTAEMQIALRFKGPGHYIDNNGLSKNLFGEYLEAILELNAGNATRLIELFQQPIARSIIALFNKHLIALTTLNDEFVSFEKRLQAPSMSVAASSIQASASAPLDRFVDLIDSHTGKRVGDLSLNQSFYVPSTNNRANTSAPLDQFLDLIDSHSGKRVADLPLDQSFYVPSTSSRASTSAQVDHVVDLIDSQSGKRVGDLSLDQSFYVPSTRSSASTSAPIQGLSDLVDLFSGKRIADLPLDKSFYVPLTSSPTYTPARTHELQRATSIPHGYQFTGKYGQAVSELDCNQSIRMMPVRN